MQAVVPQAQWHTWVYASAEAESSFSLRSHHRLLEGKESRHFHLKSDFAV
jgi:hypothetical protein